MALTVNQAFDEVLRRLELNQTRIDLASQRYAAVKGQIESALPGKKVKQIGSFQKQTKIRPVSDGDKWDIDIAVCFGDVTRYAAQGDGITPKRSLEIVRGALRSNEIYKVMDPSPDAPVVALEYYDGFKIELVPCYRELTGLYPRPAGPVPYIVPTSDGRWVPADYDYDAAHVSGLNQGAAAGHLIPMIKLFKGFVRSHALPLRSYHVEALAAKLVPQSVALRRLAGIPIDYHRLFAHLLEHSVDLLVADLKIGESYTGKVDSGLSPGQLVDAKARLTKCAELAKRINELPAATDVVGYWRELYGDPFPA